MTIYQISTFGDLQDHLGTLLDESHSGAAFWTTIERCRSINAAYFSLYGLAVKLSDGQAPTSKSAALAVVSGTATVAIPTDCHRITAIYYKESETQSYPWRAISPTDQHKWRRSLDRSSKTLAYYLQGANILMVPTPSWSEATKVRIEYVPVPTGLDAANDVPSFPLAHRELIALDAYALLKEKEQEPIGDKILMRRKELMKLFEEDMSRQEQNSRVLSGFSDYNIY